MVDSTIISHSSRGRFTLSIRCSTLTVSSTTTTTHALTNRTVTNSNGDIRVGTGSQNWGHNLADDFGIAPKLTLLLNYSSTGKIWCKSLREASGKFD